MKCCVWRPTRILSFYFNVLFATGNLLVFFFFLRRGGGGGGVERYTAPSILPPKNLKITITVRFGFAFAEHSVRQLSRDYLKAIVFEIKLNLIN